MTAEQYETIPVAVEAIQFDGSIESAQEILAWADTDFIHAVVTNDVVYLEIVIGQVKTGIGQDDWVVKDLQPGTAPAYIFTKIEPKAFAERYRLVDHG